ncbi:MAG TPA: ferrous iron transporter B, partial [Gammaproteobacteria bacterium]|nr:ferrous iron transporter B [Gammaproteobacteria bacterium]
MKKVALIGNPNCGKTTLFNLLTGARQKVGNWPGVTVEKKFGYLQLQQDEIELVDLPGIYSLEQEYQGIDEQIARDYLQQDEIHLIINIIDASNLERSLVLTQQLREMGIPIIVILNMLDVAEQQGLTLTPGKLEEQLGLPVISMVASRKQGVSELKAAMVNDFEASRAPRSEETDPENQDAEVGQQLTDPMLRRYHKSRQLVNGVVEVSPTRHSLSERVDSVVLNRWLGVPIFLLMIYLMFTFAVNFGAIFIDFFDILFAAVLVDGTSWLLEQLSMPPIVITLLAQGVGGGITLVATFIPVIGFLYLSLSLLEDSGYMSRAAFVIDRLMSGIGFF